MASLGFFAYNILSSAIDRFTSSFPIWMSFISFSHLITLCRISYTVLKITGDCEHLCLVSHLRGKTFSFSPLSMMLKVHLVKAMVFPVVMYGCESWTLKKAELRRIDAFELWCWRRLLRVPWTARRCNQSILKETSPGCSLEGLMLKLKLQYFGHLIRRTDSFEKTLMLGEIGREGDNRG